MGDYAGSPLHIAIQKRLHQEHSEIAAQPAFSNGGRLLNIIDLNAIGWAKIKSYAVRDQFIGLTAVPLKETLKELHKHFGSDQDFPYWQVFFGAPDTILPACASVLNERTLPTGCTIVSHTPLADNGATCTGPK